MRDQTPSVGSIKRDRRLQGFEVARLAEAALRKALRHYNDRPSDASLSALFADRDRLASEIGRAEADALYDRLLDAEEVRWQKKTS